MSANERANKDKNMAAYLKKHNVTRDTGKCPWGCGASLKNGGQALTAHLNVCHGSPRRSPRISPRNVARMAPVRRSR